MPSQNIAILLYPVITSRRDLVSASSKYVYNFLIKFDVTVSNLIRNSFKFNKRKLNAPKK